MLMHPSSLRPGHMNFHLGFPYLSTKCLKTWLLFADISTTFLWTEMLVMLLSSTLKALDFAEAHPIPLCLKLERLSFVHLLRAIKTS